MEIVVKQNKIYTVVYLKAVCGKLLEAKLVDNENNLDSILEYISKGKNEINIKYE